MSKLKSVKVERAGIVKVTGHRNLQSLDDYDEANEQDQCELSLAISKRNNSSNELVPLQSNRQSFHPTGSSSLCLLPAPQRQPLQEMPLQRSSLPSVSGVAINPMMMGSQVQNLINTFNNCQVAFNVNNKSSPDHDSVSRPPKRRFHILDSDSE